MGTVLEWKEQEDVGIRNVEESWREVGRKKTKDVPCNFTV